MGQRLVRGTGTELAAQLRRVSPGIRIVILTGFADDPEVVAAQDQGVVDDVIAKPCLPVTLRARVLRR